MNNQDNNPPSLWQESAVDWLSRSKERRLRSTTPQNPGEAAIAFFRPKQRGTSIKFIDNSLSLVRNDCPTVIELCGSSGTGKTWTLVTLAARFVAATRKSLFPFERGGETQPRVMIVDSRNGVLLPNLTYAVRNTLVREQEFEESDKLEDDMTDCLERVHIVQPEGADSVIATVEALRCRLPPSETFPTLVLWNGFLEQESDGIRQTEIIRQVSRLLSQRRVVLISATKSSRRFDTWEKLVVSRIKLERQTGGGAGQHNFVATLVKPTMSQSPGQQTSEVRYNLDWGGLLV